MSRWIYDISGNSLHDLDGSFDLLANLAWTRRLKHTGKHSCHLGGKLGVYIRMVRVVCVPPQISAVPVDYEPLPMGMLSG
jgi:hypothetical protein